MKLPEPKKILSGILLVVFIISITLLLWQLAGYISSDEKAQELVASYGYFAVFLVSFISGFNFIVPVPAASFIPVFMAGGLNLTVVIIFLSIGAIFANVAGYYLGRAGNHYAKHKHPEWNKRVSDLVKKHSRLVPWCVLLLATFLPFPDEVYLIPLGIAGATFRQVIPPMIVGTVIYQTVTAIGVNHIFSLLS